MYILNAYTLPNVYTETDLKMPFGKQEDILYMLNGGIFNVRYTNMQTPFSTKCSTKSKFLMIKYDTDFDTLN